MKEEKLVKNFNQFVSEDQLPGGLADKKKPADFDQEELQKGIEVELEHTKDKDLATEIAMDHLMEDPKYYSNLEKRHKEGVNESHDEEYMFIQNLKQIATQAQAILKMDPNKLNEILEQHPWAVDHVATSKDDIEEVFNFLLHNEDPAIAVHENKNKYKVPAGAKGNAKKVLKWKEEHGSEVKGMTKTGWARARQLANSEYIDRETVGRMAAFARHRKNAKVDPKHKGEPWKDNGYVAWLGWGGDTGINWAAQIIDNEK